MSSRGPRRVVNPTHGSSRTKSEEPQTRPSVKPSRRASERISTLGKPASVATSRVSGAPSGSARRLRARDKGKVRALPEHSEIMTPVSVDDSWDISSSVSGTQRHAKRRRLLQPRLSLSIVEMDDATQDEDDNSLKTAVEEEFHMLEGPDSLPWIPVDPNSQNSEYVPPGLSALIEDMKRALVVQMSAREKAESMYAEEQERRLALAQEAARLAAANRALEAERSVWTAAAAESLASSLENAIVSDITRRLTAEIFANPDRLQGSSSPSPSSSNDQHEYYHPKTTASAFLRSQPTFPSMQAVSVSGLRHMTAPVDAAEVEMSDASHRVGAGAEGSAPPF
ncbi:hypothetical protein C8Q74DRAFT_1371833 [Fomes fomentarius]|nr:hypothetical protein C8Q74DRAFT_1371833 [Fomes fomentarius]